MLASETSAFGHEWAILQHNHEQYEKSCLLIKLGAVALFVFCVALAMPAAAVLSLLLILWVQEAVCRTSQSRVGARIVQVEQMSREGSTQAAGYQLHTEWQASRPGSGGLLAEYGRSMLRPTVAFPYIVLMAMDIVWSVLV
ncbi:MAG: hypothetical protein ABWY05_08710 [Noviherbaspirillum sp.]